MFSGLASRPARPPRGPTKAFRAGARVNRCLAFRPRQRSQDGAGGPVFSAFGARQPTDVSM